jgi:hypothetical protein
VPGDEARPEARDESRTSAAGLDDEQDRSELRSRYYGLLQELRVVVTGVQVLLAFLLAVPFAQRFGELDSTAQAWFGVALTSATISVILFVTPTAMHRFGRRTARGERLAISIVVTRIGMVFLAVAILSSFGVVVSFLFGGPVPALLVALIAVTIVVLWIAVPIATGFADDRHDRERAGGAPTQP